MLEDANTGRLGSDRLADAYAEESDDRVLAELEMARDCRT